MEQKDIISRLSAVGERFRLSNAALAQNAGLGTANFAKMMKGEQKITDKTLKKISSAFGVSFDWLLKGDGEMLDYKVSQIGNDNNNQQGDGNVYRSNDEKAYKAIMLVVETNQKTTEHFIEIVKKSQEQIDRLIALLENCKTT